MASKEVEMIYSEADRIIKELNVKTIDEALKILEDKQKTGEKLLK